MTRLSKRISVNARRGRSVPAVVIDVFFDKATVKLGENGRGAVQRGLKFVGGPPSVGEIVDIDYTTPTPTLVMRGKEWLTASDLANALSDFDSGLNNEFTFSIILFSGGAAAEVYPATPEGFNTALADANTGDVIYLPDVDLTGYFVIPEGVTVSGVSKRQSILRGNVTLANDVSLENLCVLQGEYTAGEVVGVNVPAVTLRCFIRHCEIHGYNCSGGNAVGIDVAAGGKVNIEHSTVIGDSSGGSAWAVRGAAGADCKIYHASGYGKTDNYTGSGIYEYSVVDFESEIYRGCILAGEVRNTFASGLGLFQALVPDGVIQDPSGIVTDPMLTELHSTIQDFSIHSSPMLRVGDYIYVCDQDTWGSSKVPRIIEYDTMTNSSKALTTGSFYSLGGNTFFCAGEDRTIYVAYRENLADVRCVVYKLDFEAETSAEIYGWELGDDPGQLSAPNLICCVPDMNNNLHLVIYGNWQSAVVNTAETTRNGIYVKHYDIANDIWTTHTQVYSNDIYGTDQQWFHAPAQWENKLCLFPSVSVFVAEDASGNSVNVAPNGMYIICVWVFDIDTNSLTKLYRELTGIDDWTGQPALGVCSVCRSTGEVFIAIENGDGSNSDYHQHLYRWDIDSDEMTHIEKATLDDGFFSYQNNVDIYIHNISVWNPYAAVVHKASDWSLVDDNWNTYIEGTRYADSQNRCWFYRDSDEKIYAVKMDDKLDVLSFDLPYSSISDETGTEHVTVIVLSDYLGVFVNEGLVSENRNHQWLVRPNQ